MCARLSNLGTTRFEVPWGSGRDLGPWSRVAKPALLVLSSSSPTPPPRLVPFPSCFLLTPLPALPAHLGRVRRLRSECELISSSLDLAVGREGRGHPFLLGLVARSFPELHTLPCAQDSWGTLCPQFMGTAGRALPGCLSLPVQQV